VDLLTATIGLAAYKSTVAVTGTADRADADGFLAAEPLSLGWLRSVTEFAGPGTDAVERLVERTPSALLCIACLPGTFLRHSCRQSARCAVAVLS
jgi:hypothetical protein